MTIAQLVTGTVQPGMTTVQLGMTIAQPVTGTVQPVMTVVQSGMIIAQAVMIVVQPGMTPLQPGMKPKNVNLTATYFCSILTLRVWGPVLSPIVAKLGDAIHIERGHRGKVRWPRSVRFPKGDRELTLRRTTCRPLINLSVKDGSLSGVKAKHRLCSIPLMLCSCDVAGRAKVRHRSVVYAPVLPPRRPRNPIRLCAR